MNNETRNTSSNREPDQGVILTYPEPGETITCSFTKNTYTIEDKIGEGNFGIVYGCHDIWGNDLAVKVLKPKGTYQAIRSAYQAELDKLIQFRHPYITYVYDAFECRNAFYIVTERCSMTLADLFQDKKFNGKSLLRPIAHCVLQAVHFIHTNRFLHQDLHAGNIFTSFVKDEVEPKSRDALRFKVGDLGISRLIEKISPESTMANWMRPPEMINSPEFGKPDHRVDIYHLGLLFLQLLCGEQVQFSKEEILEGLPRQKALAFGTNEGDIIADALSRHVAHRPASALEMWNRLNAIYKNDQEY